MPRKTRKEKQQGDIKKDGSPMTFTYTGKTIAPTQIIQPHSMTLLKKDLTKTLVIGAAFLTLEIALSFIL